MVLVWMEEGGVASTIEVLGVDIAAMGDDHFACVSGLIESGDKAIGTRLRSVCADLRSIVRKSPC